MTTFVGMFRVTLIVRDCPSSTRLLGWPVFFNGLTYAVSVNQYVIMGTTYSMSLNLLPMSNLLRHLRNAVKLTRDGPQMTSTVSALPPVQDDTKLLCEQLRYMRKQNISDITTVLL